MTPTQTPTHFDVLVLGSGEAGKYIAWSQASAGRSAAVIERRYIGGSCPNIACLPSKNFVHTAKVAHYLSQATEFGLPQAVAPQDLKADMEVVRSRKRAMVNGLITMHEERFAQTGARLILGQGRFTAPKTIALAAADGSVQTFTGETVVVSTGSRAAIDSIPGLAEAAPLTHIEILELETLPSHLIVLGGGYIGLEFAQAMRRLGSAVTVIERNSRLLHNEDEDVTECLTAVLLREGVRILCDTAIDRVAGTSGESVSLYGVQAGTPVEIKGSHILAATGRLPNNDNIGLDLAGIDLDTNGYIRVDEHLRTSAPGVFAVGDCAGSPKFTHIAYDDYRIVRSALTGGTRSTANRQIPFSLYTDPEFAHIGLSELQAKGKGIPYRLAKLPMKAVLRTRTMDETDGFLKALVSTTDDRILGFSIVGIGGGELLPAVQLAMSSGLPYTALRDLIVTHPTLNEGLVYLFATVPALSLKP